MANYEFECKCGKVYEYLDLKNTDKKRACPKCGKLNEKVMSASTFALKAGGVGWGKKGYSGTHSISDGPEGKGNRHKRSGKTTIPVRGGFSLEGKKGDTTKKPTIKVQK